MKPERTAAALVLMLVRGRVRRILSAKTLGEAMNEAVNLDMLLHELSVAESAPRETD